MCRSDKSPRAEGDRVDWIAAVGHALEERHDAKRQLERHRADYDRDVFEKRLTDDDESFAAWEKEALAALCAEELALRDFMNVPLPDHVARLKAGYDEQYARSRSIW